MNYGTSSLMRSGIMSTPGFQTLNQMSLISSILTVLLSCIVGLFCVCILTSEIIRVVRLFIAYIKHDEETIDRLTIK